MAGNSPGGADLSHCSAPIFLMLYSRTETIATIFFRLEEEQIVSLIIFRSTSKELLHVRFGNARSVKIMVALKSLKSVWSVLICPDLYLI